MFGCSWVPFAGDATTNVFYALKKDSVGVKKESCHPREWNQKEEF